MTVDLLKVAQSLDQQVDMTESELRDMLKKIFTTVPTYHIKAVARMVKKGSREGRIEVLAKKVGGLIG